MGAGRRKFTKEFKEEAVRRLGLGVSLTEVARAREVNPNVLHRWRQELQDYGTKAFAGNGQRRADESQVAELERKVGRQALEIDFLRRCLQHVEEQGGMLTLSWTSLTVAASPVVRAAEAASIGFPQLVYPYLEKEMSLATPIPLERLCRLALVSRAGFYRWRDAVPATDTDLDLRDEIQRIALEFPYYG